MLKILILIALSFNVASAKSRFSDDEKQKFMTSVQQGIAGYKTETSDSIDLKAINLEIDELLETFVEEKKITRSEKEKIKKGFEDLSKDPSLNSGNAEEKLNKFITDKFNEINQTPLEKIKEGKVCNNLVCEEGLQCLTSRTQEDRPKCKMATLECKEDKDCCSSSCKLNPDRKIKMCERISLCFRPLRLGESCVANPVCAVGTCSEFNSKTLGIGECSDNGSACGKNTDCCSNSCENKKCVRSLVCKDCVGNGDKVANPKKCCEGLYPNDKGVCIPDLPPLVFPQVRSSVIHNIVAALGSLFISSAEATDPVTQNNIATSIPVTIERKSDFNTCDIHLRDDFFSELKEKNLLNLELATLAFDYVLLGEGTNDYWKSGSSANSSIYGRLKVVAQNHQEKRKKMNDKFKAANTEIKCMCLDVIGYDNIKDEVKKKFFKDECPEFSEGQTARVCHKQVPCTNLEGESQQIACTGDTRTESCAEGEAGCACEGDPLKALTDDNASGLKGKRLLTKWTTKLTSLNSSLTRNNTATYTELAGVRDWVGNWNKGERKETFIYKYTIKKAHWFMAWIKALDPGTYVLMQYNMGSDTNSPMVTAMTALNSGVSATWATDSLLGAWQNDKLPYLNDVVTASSNCGPKGAKWLYKCTTHSVYLNHPYNSVCNSNSYANACIKNFMAVYPNPANDSGVPRYIVDPWVPFGVDKALLIKSVSSGRNYVESLGDAFPMALGAIAANGDHPGISIAQYAHFGFRINNSNSLILTPTIITEIKNKAKDFAIAEEIFEKSDTANLDAFAEYAYEYHFLQPKLSVAQKIAYPLVGLNPYLEYMANGVYSLGAGAGNGANTFGNLNAKYLEDYLASLQLYADLPTNQTDSVKLAALNAEIAHVKAELSSQLVFNEMANNIGQGEALGTTTAGHLSNGVLTGDQTATLNAIKTLRTAGKEQLSRLSAYNRGIAGNGNLDRAKSIAAASKSFGAKFGAALSSYSGKGSLGVFGSGGMDGLGVKSGSDDKNKSDSGSKNNAYGSGGYGSTYGSGSGSGSGHRSSSSGSKSGVTDDKSVNAEVVDEDGRRLAEAIEARNKANQSKYQSNDEQTIFEKVTNAYIRNYDKILNKKKDKDVIEER